LCQLPAMGFAQKASVSFHPLSGKTLCQLLAQGALPSKGSSPQIDTPIFFGQILFSSSRF
jgi:hypothetical protein